MSYNFKNYMELQKGSHVKCVKVWSHSKHNITKGKIYEVLHIEKRHESYKRTWKFCIKDDLGRARWYRFSNSMFEVNPNGPIQLLQDKKSLAEFHASDLWVLRDVAQKMLNNPVYSSILLTEFEGLEKLEQHELEHFIGEVSAKLMTKVHNLIK